MTWEETIQFIRGKDQYRDLVMSSYLDENLQLNVERFRQSEEFHETVKIIQKVKPGKIRILDVGCGNGISSAAFALLGHQVTAIDPDASDTVGTGAVKRLRDLYNLTNLTVETVSAEEYEPTQQFDLVYCRQAMHHAFNLNAFIVNITQSLTKGGILFTVRDHVIFGKKDKVEFLRVHPLHKFYQGENAYTRQEYKRAIQMAGLRVIKELAYFDSVINFFPQSVDGLNKLVEHENELIKKNLRRLGIVGENLLALWIYHKLVFDPKSYLNEKAIPGRMYSYFCVKE